MEAFIGQIQPFGFNFAPRGWAKCEGQLLAISSYQALFSLLGTTYGGDGRTTLALPDLRGRTAIGEGTGPGLAARALGSRGGAQTVTLAEAHMPAHSHSLHAETKAGDSPNPNNKMLGLSPAGNLYVSPDPAQNKVMAAESITGAGAGQSFDNEAPYEVVNWCICLEGIFPSRN